MSILKTSLLVLGGGGLFAGSFLGFTVATGHSFHDIPLLSKLAHDPVQPIVVPPHPVDTLDAPAEPEHAAETPPAPAVKPPATASVLGAFMLPAPFSSDELADMQARLAARLAEAESTLAAAKAKETALDERERALLGREAELKKLKDDVETNTKDLIVRELELKRDADATEAREQQGWLDLARFFQEGEPEDLAKKLSMLDPLKGALILRQLDDERAIAIVNALPPEKYKEFLDAYRKNAHGTTPTGTAPPK